MATRRTPPPAKKVPFPLPLPTASASTSTVVEFSVVGAVETADTADAAATGAPRATHPTTRGKPSAGLSPTLPAGLTQGHVRHRLRLSSLRSAAPQAAEVRVQAVPGRDVVVLHLAGGPSLVLHPEHARQLLSAQQPLPATARGPANGAANSAPTPVPTRLAWDGLDTPTEPADSDARSRAASRGLLGHALLSGLEIVRDAAGPSLAAGAATLLAERIDAQAAPGLHLLQAQALPQLKDSGSVPVTQLPDGGPSDGPLLVLIHGTFSNTASAFDKLWREHPQRVATLFSHYRSRIYGFEHATLGVGPIANALALVRALPPAARLHLLTHSRGGLVAEVLARVAANPTLQGESLNAFSAADQRDLTALGTEMARRQLRIDRVVRVACPARGTLLASKRLDAYLSVFQWTLQLAAVPVLPALVDFLAAVAQQRTSPDILPGLAAQVPDSPLVQWLHAAAEPLPGELRVIAGDVQGDSVGSWLKTLVTDSFYWTDNDFVVQTRSMYGGAGRAGGALFLLDRGGGVSHGEYFSNARTAEAACNALVQDRPEGFGVIGPLSWQGSSSSGSRAPQTLSRNASSERPAVILLPGIAGSHLAVNGQRIWLSLRLVGGFSHLAWPDAPGHPVSADGLIGPVYANLAAHLAASHEVIEFAYDWRRPIADEAARLAGVAEAALTARAASGQPVRFVAHSMGGLVVRSLALHAPGLWQRLMAQPGARVLMLGTPNAGSWAPMQVLSGDDAFGNTLAAFGAPFRDHAARQWMAEMPGFLQLQRGLTDPALGLDQHSTWQALADADVKSVEAFNRWHNQGLQLDVYRWGVPPQAVLDAARDVWRALDAQRERDLAGFAEKILLVVGRARYTPDGVEMGLRGLVYRDAVDAGDGRVTHASALLPGVSTWAVECEHGALADHAPAFAAYVELLSDGLTSQSVLSPIPPTPSTDAASLEHVLSRPSRQSGGFVPPQRESAIGDAVGETGAHAKAMTGALADETALAIEIVNGNLMFMPHPLLVGHYRSSQLTGTEAVVNGLIGGAMQLALMAGIYPDRPGTHQMFRHTGPSDNPLQLPRPEWAIVVGLGDESALKPADLVHSLRQAIVDWGQRIGEAPGVAPPTFELASTLLGSGGTGITPGQSAQLIAQAARQANRSLALCGWPRLGKLHLVELYLDRASEAWRGLQALAATAPSHWRVAAEIRGGAGALRRPLDTSYRGADYDLISAESRAGPDKQSSIVYTLDTKRARAELRSQATQAGLVRELVQRASTERGRDSRIGRTLYQLLVPAEMDPFLGGTTEMRLKLDRGSAGIPWELLQNEPGAGGDPRPWSVRTKLMRSLITDDFRRAVRDADSQGGVLVVGEPAGPQAMGAATYGRLPGARAEAQAVVAAFGATADVHALIADGGPAHTAPDAQQVLNALLERDWQVVHIAGHGAPSEIGGATRGVVLSHGFLGPAEIQAMRTVPELVFVNCCFLAERPAEQLLAGPGNLVQFASTVADALINLGVRCVIAAGWAVDDSPAETFATAFYGALLRGQRFIDAAALARERAWDAAPDSNTWAAYQCYGDPNWTLRRDSAKAAPAPPSERFAGVSSPLALTLALETVAVEARAVRGADDAERAERRDVQRQRLAYLQGRFADLWGGMGAVAEAYALAWSELGDTQPAIDWYRRAVDANDGSASQQAAEQWANLRVRAAEGRVTAALARAREDGTLAAPETAALTHLRSQARSEIGAALRSIEHLLALSPTMTRHSLAGSANKRLAMIESDAGRERAALTAIAAMKRHFAAAQTRSRETGSPDLHHPGLNRLAAELASDAALAGWNGFDASDVDAVRRSLDARSRTDPDFWSVVGLTELRLYEAVAGRRLALEAASIAADWRALHGRISAPRNWRSVHDTIRFVLERYLRRAPAAEQRACRHVLELLLSFAWPPGEAATGRR